MTTPKALRVALVRSVELPEADHDEPVTLDAFRARGHEAHLVGWDGGNARSHVRDGAKLVSSGGFGAYDAVLIRATWNYHLHADDFLRWVRAAAAQAPVHNPPRVVEMNAHKSYLNRLAEAGVPAIPTVVVERGAGVDVKRAAEELGSASVVLKPAVSGSSFMTKRFDLGTDGAADGDGAAGAAAFARALGAERDWMVQPVMKGFADPGERNLVRIDGVWTHAVSKQPRFAGDDERVEAGELPTAEERELGERALAALVDEPGELLFARVDVIRSGETGDLMVSEVELIEPSLFFFADGSGDAVRRLVRGVEQRAG
jgi:glutathione synthase/RimK-type ligase-like ATP-grasp enzyme